MELLGLITLIIIYWCLFFSYITGKVGWIFLCFWCIPIIGLCTSYKPDMEINGLMVLLCLLFFFLCRKGLLDTLMWNIKTAKRKNFLFLFLYIICGTVFYYSMLQAQLLGYIWDIQGVRSVEINYARSTFSIALILLIALPLTNLLYYSVDRFYCKETELILLRCKFLESDENGLKRNISRGYFLNGINNGVNYHFRMTKRMYIMLKKEENLRLHVKTGLLGGLYVTKNPCLDNEKKARRRDRKIAIIGFLMGISTMIFGVWLFWFSKI